MRKIILLLMMIILSFINASYAQIYDTTQYYGKMNYIFQYVNKTPIATGMLRDYGIDF